MSCSPISHPVAEPVELAAAAAAPALVSSLCLCQSAPALYHSPTDSVTHIRFCLRPLECHIRIGHSMVLFGHCLSASQSPSTLSCTFSSCHSWSPFLLLSATLAESCPHRSSQWCWFVTFVLSAGGRSRESRNSRIPIEDSVCRTRKNALIKVELIK